MQRLRPLLWVDPGVEVFDGYISAVLFIERLLGQPASCLRWGWLAVKLAEAYEIPKARRVIRADCV